MASASNFGIQIKDFPALNNYFLDIVISHSFIVHFFVQKGQKFKFVLIVKFGLSLKHTKISAIFLMPHTWLILTKRFTNLNLDVMHLGL